MLNEQQPAQKNSSTPHQHTPPSFTTPKYLIPSPHCPWRTDHEHTSPDHQLLPRIQRSLITSRRIVQRTHPTRPSRHRHGTRNNTQQRKPSLLHCLQNPLQKPHFFSNRTLHKIPSLPLPCLFTRHPRHCQQRTHYPHPHQTTTRPLRSRAPGQKEIRTTLDHRSPQIPQHHRL